MIISRCCKDYLQVHHTEECSFYVCSACQLPCDTIVSIEIDKEEYGRDPRSKIEVKESAYFS